MSSWDSSVRITVPVYLYSDQENQWQTVNATTRSYLRIASFTFHFEITYLPCCTHPPLGTKKKPQNTQPLSKLQHLSIKYRPVV